MKTAITTKRQVNDTGKNGFRKKPGSAIVIGDEIRIPSWVKDLPSFRRWAHSDSFPEHGWFSHLNGELWVDVSMETIGHNQLKEEVSRVGGNLAKAQRKGRFFADRMLLTNSAVGLSTEPDGMYVSFESLDAGRVVCKEGNESLEILGSPDLVLEIISKTSVRKDTVVLMDLYWKAGITEYWLADLRNEIPTFEIFRHAARKYLPVRKLDDWVTSKVFGQSFKLSMHKNSHGLTDYLLEVR